MLWRVRVRGAILLRRPASEAELGPAVEDDLPTIGPHGSLRHFLAIPLALLLLVSCGSDDQTAQGDVLPSLPIPPDLDPGWVHGLGVNPADGDVYAATHFGPGRVPQDGEAHRVGDTAHDLMGFTVVGPDDFVASGHPVMTDELPPLLGLIATTDAGKTWRSRVAARRRRLPHPACGARRGLGLELQRQRAAGEPRSARVGPPLDGDVDAGLRGGSG